MPWLQPARPIAMPGPRSGLKARHRRGSLEPGPHTWHQRGAAAPEPGEPPDSARTRAASPCRRTDISWPEARSDRADEQIESTATGAIRWAALRFQETAQIRQRRHEKTAAECSGAVCMCLSLVAGGRSNRDRQTSEKSGLSVSVVAGARNHRGQQKLKVSI